MDRCLKGGEFMIEQITTGRHYRIMGDFATKTWHRISFWKKAQDIHFDNSMTLQDTCGNIQGITDSLTSDSSNIIASVAALKALNDKTLSF